MGNKKTANRVAPKVSSATSVSAAAATHKTNASSIIRSAFSPSLFQLSLFASVIQSLDSHQLRIHDTVSGRLRCEYLAARARINSLDWGFHGSDPQFMDGAPTKKKKRRLEETNGTGKNRFDIVVGLGTSDAEILLFSPAEAKVLARLTGGHTESVSDFKFSNHGRDAEGWSMGNDKKLIQWNLRDGSIARSISLSISLSEPLSAMLPLKTSIIVASNVVYIVDLNGQGKAMEVGKEINSIHTLVAEYSRNHYNDPSRFLIASTAERYLNVRDTVTGELVGSLVAGGDVQSIATDEDGEEKNSKPCSHQVLAAVTKNGEVELFNNPLVFDTQAKEGESLKSKLKQKTRQHSAKISITRPDKRLTSVPLVATAFHENELVIAYQEESGHLGFERVTWRKDKRSGLALSGLLVLTKAKTLIGLDKEGMNGVKDMGLTHIDESKTVVSHGNAEQDAMALDQQDVIDISSAEEEEEHSSSEDEEDAAQSNSKGLVNGTKHEDAAMKDTSAAEDSDSDASEDSRAEEKGETENEPSFGELLRAKAGETIDVAASFPERQEQSVVPYGKGSTSAPSGMTLATVLSQSLRTNDVGLLETCFHERDLNVVRATIERLDSTLAITLLQKLADRLYSRPGRAGSLMVWIQWTLVSHGGHLGAQPDIVKRLTALHGVIKERANSLQPLLALKGKLDMLEAQLNLRRSMNSRYGTGKAANDEDDEDVIYVEGQDNSSSSEEDEMAEGSSKRRKAPKDEEMLSSSDDSGSDDEDEVMPDVNGLKEGADEESEEDDEDYNSENGAGGLIDDEASETDDNEGEDYDEGAIDYDDLDSGEEDGSESESEEEAEQAPLASSLKIGGGRDGGRPLTNGVSSKKGKPAISRH